MQPSHYSNLRRGNPSRRLGSFCSTCMRLRWTNLGCNRNRRAPCRRRTRRPAAPASANARKLRFIVPSPYPSGPVAPVAVRASKRTPVDAGRARVTGIMTDKPVSSPSPGRGFARKIDVKCEKTCREPVGANSSSPPFAAKRQNRPAAPRAGRPSRAACPEALRRRFPSRPAILWSRDPFHPERSPLPGSVRSRPPSPRPEEAPSGRRRRRSRRRAGQSGRGFRQNRDRPTTRSRARSPARGRCGGTASPRREARTDPYCVVCSSSSSSSHSSQFTASSRSHTSAEMVFSTQ